LFPVGATVLPRVCYRGGWYPAKQKPAQAGFGFFGGGGRSGSRFLFVYLQEK